MRRQLARYRKSIWAQLAMLVVAIMLLAGCPPSIRYPLPEDPPGEHWLRIAHISDPQLVDEESPARTVKVDRLIPTAWRPQDPYLLHALDAMVRTVNTHHEAGKANGRPVDFALITGDLGDLAQHNTLRWLIDTLDGGTVEADSGDDDRIRRGVSSEKLPNEPFQAAGLAEDIPWYTVFGNHDGLAVGNFRVWKATSDPRGWRAPLLPPVAELVGLHDLNPLWNALTPTSRFSPAVLPGDREPMDPRTFQLPVLSLDAGPITPDGDRHFLSRKLFVQAHMETSSTPAGHGFSAQNLDDNTVRYSVRPNPDVPVRLVVMDTVPPRIPYGYPAFHGVMTREQFENFVQPEVEAANARGEFVILASHHPSADFSIPFPPDDTISAETFRDYLTAQPNVIAHLCGHSHRHFVQRHDGPNPYVEIETASIIDYPQEGRIIDVFYDEAEDTFHLKSTIISHLEHPTPQSEEAFARAAMDAGAADLFDDPNRQKNAKKLFESGSLEKSERPVLPEWPAPSLKNAGEPKDRNAVVSLPR